MPLTREDIDRLRFEGESPALDFKRDQYPFAEATDPEKAELLKDVLAFANSWRDREADILIGLDSSAGSPAVVSGVAEHLPDADLQQFVNSKTNRPITFSYEVAHYEAVQVGVIRIAVQDRPFYLRKPFGPLKPSVVYIRRGSSTAEATPDETAQMGRLGPASATAAPAFQVRLADPESGQDIPNPIALHWNPLLPLAPTKLNALSKRVGDPSRYPVDFIDGQRKAQSASQYCRDLAEYITKESALRRFAVVVSNQSLRLATGVRLELRVKAPETLEVIDISDEPQKPERAELFHVSVPHFRPVQQIFQGRIVDVVRRGADTFIEAELRNVQPRTIVRTDDYFLIRGEGDVTLEGAVSCDQAPPQPVQIELTLSPEPREMTLESIYLRDPTLRE